MTSVASSSDNRYELAMSAADMSHEAAGPGERVSWAELFFVFAVTEVSSLVHREHSWGGCLRALIVCPLLDVGRHPVGRSGVELHLRCATTPDGLGELMTPSAVGQRHGSRGPGRAQIALLSGPRVER